MLKPAGECWVITDGAAGNQRQALALAEQLDRPIRSLVLSLRAPWSWLAPRRLPGGRLALPAAERTALTPPWPEVVIGCGRAAGLLTRLVRRLSGGRSYAVQILDPRIDPAHWDEVIAPAHDGLRGANVTCPLGSLNPVDADWLAEARQAFAALGQWPGPRLALLLGGPRHGMTLDAGYLDRLVDGLRQRRAREGGSLLLLASRRTPSAWTAHLQQALADWPGLRWLGPQDGPNPYPGVLGWADRLVVTPDSVNMLSEACATGRPVHSLVVGTLPPRLASFHRALTDSGRLHPLLAETAASQPPLRETQAIGQQLRERIAQHLARRP